jgi:hypothetical protein
MTGGGIVNLFNRMYEVGWPLTITGLGFILAFQVFQPDAVQL